MLNLIKTEDGSNSLLNTALDETYHSRHGAIQESLYVFIKKGLQYWLEKNNASEVSILEVGFGTGLNALLSLQESVITGVKTHYTTIEAFPVELSIIEKLNYAKQLNFQLASKYFRDLHWATWDIPVTITTNFTLEKRKEKIQELDSPSRLYDLIFFDAFAPNKQPEMWEMSVLEKVTATMQGNSVFITYCAKGQLKRDLKALGLKVETLPGPPGKREMVRAVKLNP